MPIALLRPLLTYVIGPLLIALWIFFKGYNMGASAARESMREEEARISHSLRQAEQKNEEIRYEQEKERHDIYGDSLARVICLFNSYFGSSSRSCDSFKAHKAQNQGLYEACLSEKDFRELYLYLQSQDDYIYQLLNLMAPVVKSAGRPLKEQSVR